MSSSTQTFNNWTEYDSWLVNNYNNYSIYKIDEENGKITATFCPKDELKDIIDSEQKEKQ